ncbi:spindle and centriole-associated protein 1 isoform X2 [Colossoma macropomum]|uniref:spindle and centriole-associated protein 1 isoform X2 n=1 Tax=Colossoma macropomum TaxID=42526 RepID=UPI0018649C7D|nr:spindle and centriole-associated protein 1 isoform X2 [Colossoma macropomum]
MSFVRINRRPGRTKKVSVPKKEWVSTVTDLSVHKATPEELSRRHEMHKSHNKALAQWELREKGLKRMQKKAHPASPPGLDQARLRIIREVLSDQCQLQDVLARSDRAMAVVKDLFGDAPRRQTGFPNVTMAPDCDSDSELPVLQKPDPPTQLSLLSQSMMDQQALNELEDSAAEHGEDDQDSSVSFNSEMCRPKRKTCKAKPPQWTIDQRLQQQNLPQTPCNAAGSDQQAALNATVAVERLKSRQSQSDTIQSTTLVTQVLNPEPATSHSGGKSKSSRTTRRCSPGTSGLDGSGFSSQSANQSSLELLQDMLGQVETELAYLEPQGPLSSSQPPNLHRGLTGFSVALVATLGRIASHLRRREEEAQKEAQVRKSLEEEVGEQRALIDALSAECLSLREESAALQESLRERTTELEQRLDMVILGLGDLGSGKEEREIEPQDGAVPRTDAMPLHTERLPQKQVSETPAVLLSPPRQRDSRAPPAARSRSLRFEGSHSTASAGSLEDSEARCTPSSFISLPDSVLPRPVPLLDHPPQYAGLQQIAELTSQNGVIQAQLGQFCPSHTRASVSRELDTDRLSPVNTKDRQPSPSTGQQPKQQCVGAADSSVRLMEERLQQLNRQSAAARAKLLELIEQQKQTTSLNVSPSISPIPPQSISPNTDAGRLTQGSCVFVSERGHPSNTNSRRSAEAVSPQSEEGGERRVINTQVDKLKGEGWFALSAHIR